MCMAFIALKHESMKRPKGWMQRTHTTRAQYNYFSYPVGTAIIDINVTDKLMAMQVLWYRRLNIESQCTCKYQSGTHMNQSSISISTQSHQYNIICFQVCSKSSRCALGLLLSCTVCACTDTTGEPLNLNPSRRPHPNTDSCRYDPTITVDGNVLAPLKPQYCRTLETGMTVSKPLTPQEARWPGSQVLTQNASPWPPLCTQPYLSDHTWAIISCCRAHFYALQVRIWTI